VGFIRLHPATSGLGALPGNLLSLVAKEARLVVITRVTRHVT
jgi:hypothetical protein